MVQSRRMVLLAVLVALLALSVGVAGAAPRKGGKGQSKSPAKKATVTWSEKRVVREVAPGTTTNVIVTVTSNTEIKGATLWVVPGLGRILTISPTSVDLPAGTPVNITLKIAMPQNAVASQGGTVKVLSGKRTIPTPLNVQVQLPGAENED